MSAAVPITYLFRRYDAYASYWKGNGMEILELVLRQSNGAIFDLNPLKRAASILGREPQTIRNQLGLGKCALSPVRMGRSVFFRADDLAREIVQAQTQRCPRGGRPTKSEKMRGEFENG